MEARSIPEVVLCLYHDDADGRCAAAIVRRALGSAVQLQAMDYQAAVPWEKIESADQLVIVDFSLNLADMQRACRSGRVVWIDHHKSAIEALAVLTDLPGIRSLDEAGCVLTWQYYFPQDRLPLAVQLIGDKDVWRFAHAETAAFSAALFRHNTQPQNDKLWRPLLEDEPQLLAELIEQGKLLHAADLERIRRRVLRDGFEVFFEGHRTLVLNDRGSGYTGEAIRKMGYTIAYCYIDRLQGTDIQTSVTLYSEQVDVAGIAEKYGGGGHAGAAGFAFLRHGGPFPESAQVDFPPSLDAARHDSRG